MTLLRLAEKHQYAVIEMGANHLGEIAHLREIASPDIALHISYYIIISIYGVTSINQTIFIFFNSDSQYKCIDIFHQDH
jgi:hypothetical protein